ncbi:guanine nucleotide-binding protein-like 1 isoform X2 [Cephus cinctus]|uniref:Guanine nucleotide-binding protein-like 1 n=1 Tax=Cephus cinctus TaxID=211228 RepID=A0AAJ7BNK9_CEPCN|nr:guanine nucleotide-binding protein-like 1 isoform X2 [Cephus cinctus]
MRTVNDSKMPQGRRRAPFSGKAKKQQMQAKKQRQNRLLLGHHSRGDDDEGSDDVADKPSRTVQKINLQPKDRTSKSKYALQFFRETKEELQRRKEEARQTIEPIPLEQQEISDNFFPPGIDMPKRPPWDFNITKEQLESREQRYFTEYLKNIETIENIGYFELNLETWRQLWRVLEMSDILLIIVDIRYPVLMFPPYLYHYITEDLEKDMILILNKIDLASPALVVAWHNYFREQYPKIHVLEFTSFPGYNLRGNTEDGEGLKKRRRRGKLKMAAEGAQKLFETCKEIVSDKVDLSSWHQKIQEEMNSEYDLDDIDRKDNVTIEKEDTSYFKHEKYKNGVLTIGCIGTPNVGKSSLMNALMGKKVVSVSRTPGHTKHFQTIFLTKSVCLCDCPGLVFPSTVPKQLQILMGSFPIAQVREPYTTIKFIAERIDLPKLLRLQHPSNDDTWSAMDICDGWAAKRNYKTAKAARLDSYRAANSLLRMALEGKICIYAYPPGWAANKEKWEKHSDVEIVRWIQAKSQGEVDPETERVFTSSDEDEEEHPDEQQESSKDQQDNDSTDSTDDDLDMPVTVNKFKALTTAS